MFENSFLQHRQPPTDATQKTFVGVRLSQARSNPVTDATSHGWRSFLVVFAASRRSRRTSSPLRGGHGEGLCPFMAVTADVFVYQLEYIARFISDLRFLIEERSLLGVCALLRYLRRQALFFWTKSKINNPKQAPKMPPPTLTVGGGHGGQRHPAVEVMAVFCVRGQWSWRSRAEADGDLAVKTP